MLAIPQWRNGLPSAEFQQVLNHSRRTKGLSRFASLPPQILRNVYGFLRNGEDRICHGLTSNLLGATLLQIIEIREVKFEEEFDDSFRAEESDAHNFHALAP